MNLSKPIKGLFFDIEGTLNYNASGHWMFPINAENLINMDGIYFIPIKRFNSAYKKCRDYLKSVNKVSTIEQEYECYKKFYAMLAEYLPEFEITKDKIELLAQDKVYNEGNSVFYEDAYDTLSVLSKKYKLGIISESWPSCVAKLKSSKMYDLLSSTTLSHMLGVSVPHKKMFEHALDNIGLPAEQTLLIDDSKENLDAAKNYGMQTMLLDTKSNNKDNDFITINSLSELLAYL